MATSGVHLSACPCRCFLFGRFRSSFPCLSSSSHSSSLLLLLLNSSRAGFGSRERERDFHGGWVTRESRPLETLGRKLRPSHISGVHHVVLRFPIHSTPLFFYVFQSLRRPSSSPAASPRDLPKPKSSTASLNFGLVRPVWAKLFSILVATRVPESRYEPPCPKKRTAWSNP